MAAQSKSNIGYFGTLGIIFLVLLGLGLIMNALDGVQGTKGHPPPTAKTATSPPPTIPKPSNPPLYKTPAEYLKTAKDQLAMKSPDRPYGNFYHAAYLLSFIPKDAPEFPEAQRLFKQIERCKEKDLAALHQKEAHDKRGVRLLYAPIIENDFLDKGHDVTVKVEGKDATTLKIKWILVSRVFAHQISKDQQLIKTWRDMGFRKVILTDGYRSKWQLDL